MTVKSYTRAQIEEKIERLHEDYPQLRGWEPDAEDHCCGLDQAAARFGWEVAWVWDTIHSWQWLLGDR